MSHYLDHLIARHTAFSSMADLLNSAPNYRPSCDVQDPVMLKIADAYDAEMAKRGDPRVAYRYNIPRRLEVGDSCRVHINQGVRVLRCLAVTDDRALMEYFMPAGNAYLWDVPRCSNSATLSGRGVKGVRNVSANRPPKRWAGVLSG